MEPVSKRVVVGVRKMGSRRSIEASLGWARIGEEKSTVCGYLFRLIRYRVPVDLMD